MSEPCKCWLMSPAVLHEGHCCFLDDTTPLEEMRVGVPPSCGHWVDFPKGVDTSTGNDVESST